MIVINEIESDLNSIISRDFGEIPIEDSFNKWLHYQARKIPKISRDVLISSEVERHMRQYPAIGKIHSALKHGHDVEPWLSKSIRRCKSNIRSDEMFNDWQISHFHLGNEVDRNSAIERTNYLLFVHITNCEATLLDVQPHGAWTRKDLVRILDQTNPKVSIKLIPTIPQNDLIDLNHETLRKMGIIQLFPWVRIRFLQEGLLIVLVLLLELNYAEFTL